MNINKKFWIWFLCFTMSIATALIYKLFYYPSNLKYIVFISWVLCFFLARDSLFKGKKHSIKRAIIGFAIFVVYVSVSIYIRVKLIEPTGVLLLYMDLFEMFLIWLVVSVGVYFSWDVKKLQNAE